MTLYWKIFGAVIALIGLAFVGGGAWLAALGGSWYYVLAGLLLVVSGVLIYRRDRRGMYCYLAAWLGTLVWAIWEVGFDGWKLMPRLLAPTVLLLFVVVPYIARSMRRHPPRPAMAAAA